MKRRLEDWGCHSVGGEVPVANTKSWSLSLATGVTVAHTSYPCTWEVEAVGLGGGGVKASLSYIILYLKTNKKNSKKPTNQITEYLSM